MPRRLLAAFCLLLLPVLVQGQEPFPGETLISPMSANDTHLLDMDGNVVQTWHGSDRPKALAYMLDDGSIVRPCRDAGGAFNVNTAGGRIQHIDAADNIVWDYLFSTEQYQQHHDIQPMPGGNVLVIAWEKRTLAEAQALGAMNVTGEIWSTLVAEIEPVGATGGNIVWEWHLWDHLVQDVDPEKPGYGVVADHPELLNINDPNLAASGDWFHENAVDYNPELDQVVICSRKTDEFYIIDHSTTTVEAAGHSGGTVGRGGDFLYRWGNPQVYGRGSPADHHFNILHGVNWVDAGLPGAGNLIAFSNGTDYSVVVECTPPVQGDGTYFLAPGEAYGPAEPTWTYGGPGGFYGGATYCGGVRLPNGNTLVTATQTGYVFEVTAAGTMVWEYDDPARIALGLRYWTDETAVTSSRDAMAVPTVVLEANHPNPFNPQTTIAFDLPKQELVTLRVFGMAGRSVRNLIVAEDHPPGRHKVIWNGRDDFGRGVASGTYFYRLEAGNCVETKRMVLVR